MNEVNFSNEQLLALASEICCKQSLLKTIVIQLIKNQNGMSGSTLRLYKNPRNTNQTIVQNGDVVIGFAATNRFVEAVFVGEDNASTTDWANYRVVREFDVE